MKPLDSGNAALHPWLVVPARSPGIFPTLAEAQADLVEAALDFVDAWEAELRAAPNQRHKSGHARRVQRANDRARAAEVLFGATPGSPPR